jgi:hypothetical protein
MKRTARVSVIAAATLLLTTVPLSIAQAAPGDYGAIAYSEQAKVHPSARATVKRAL